MKCSLYGFSFIEVLVSLLLLSIILLGFDAAELFSLRTTREAYYFNVATHQLNAMTERLIALDHYHGLEQQVVIWNEQNKEILPKGRGKVEGHFPNYLITVCWGKSECLKEKMELSASG